MACVYGVHLTHLSLSRLALPCPAYLRGLSSCSAFALCCTVLDSIEPCHRCRTSDIMTIQPFGEGEEGGTTPQIDPFSLLPPSPFLLLLSPPSPCSFLPALFLVTPSPPPFSFSLHPPSRIMTCRDETSSVSQFKSSRAIRGVHYSLSSRLFFFFLGGAYSSHIY